MSEKQYRFTTKTHDFESDNVGLDCLKEENGVFYARENKQDNWSQLKLLEHRTSSYEWWTNNKGGVAFFSYIIAIVCCVVGCNIYSVPDWLKGVIAIMINPLSYTLICILLDVCFIDSYLKSLPSYFKPFLEKEIENIIAQNKRLATLGTSSTNKGDSGRYSGGGSGGSSSRSSGGGGSGGASGSSSYVSSLQLEKALNDLEAKGITWGDLVNNKTDAEREKLFAEHFGNTDQGISASERFNKEDVWPSRKAHLKKLIEDGDYENESDKQQLSEKLSTWGEEMTNDSFQKFAREIKNFTEKKQRKENHIKYEGRLSNKAIQEIKEYHGYVCMGCGLDPVAEYGENMKGILEAHHKKPWAEIENEQTREVNANDFFVLCPNCHKMIHKLDQPDSLDELKEILNPPRKISWWD